MAAPCTYIRRVSSLLAFSLGQALGHRRDWGLEGLEPGFFSPESVGFPSSLC
ncbi:hypothetical protein BJX62DRAFT_202482 [Aspergillus germanicus]